jgi:hypothetical protein
MRFPRCPSVRRHACGAYGNEVLLRALLRHVSRTEVGTPERLLNNGLNGYASLPMRLYS